MSQRVIAFTGISGVGKTSFLSKLREHLVFQHVTGGSVIAAARNVARGNRDNIRHADLDENQRLLIEGFSLACDRNAELVILDGHVVIDDGEGLTKISSDVFKALDVKMMVHLEADPVDILRNRSNDKSRSRPMCDLEILQDHQDTSRQYARSIAGKLLIDFHIVTHKDIASLAILLKEAH